MRLLPWDDEVLEGILGANTIPISIMILIFAFALFLHVVFAQDVTW